MAPSVLLNVRMTSSEHLSSSANSFFRVALACAVLLSASACAVDSSVDDGSEATGAAVRTGLWPSVNGPTSVADHLEAPSNATDFPIFHQFPRAGKMTMSENRTLPIPYWAPDVDGSYVIGLGDYAEAEALTAGSGYKPYKFIVDGAERAVVRMIFLYYRSSDLGTYTESDVSIDVGPESLGEKLNAKWVNSYSAIVPYLTIPETRLFLQYSTVDSQLALDADYELLGLSKEVGKTIGSLTHDRVSYGYLQDGERAVSLQMSVDGGNVAKAKMAASLTRALGPSHLGALNPPDLVGLNTLNADARKSGSWAAVDYTADLRLDVNEWSSSDTFVADRASRVGSFFQRAHFRPLLKARDAHLSFVVAGYDPQPCPTYASCTNAE